MASIVNSSHRHYHPAAPPADLYAAFADFLRIDVASGDASPDTVRSYRARGRRMWVAWCVKQGSMRRPLAVMHIKRLPFRAARS